MTTARPDSGPFKVLVAGGGVAALEAVLALRELGGDRVRSTLMAPNPEFVYRPMSVRQPFGYSAAERYPLAEIANDLGLELRVDRFAWVDAAKRVVHTDSGQQLHYDALVLGLGARARSRYRHVITIDDSRLDELLHGLIQDIEGGYVNRLAFVVPPRMAWPLPIYELALMSAARAYDSNIELEVTLVTPEDTPLKVFGEGASAAVAELLVENRIEVITSAHCEIPEPGCLVIDPGHRRREVDRIVALPELDGPAVRGLPTGSDHFIPVDLHCKVRGVKRVFAAGDATDFPIKHGGIAADQADTAAAAIAALAGAPVEPEAFHPVIRGMLLTGSRPRYLTAQIVGGQGFRSEVTDSPPSTPTSKIAARYLAPYLREHDRMSGSAA